MDNIMKKNAGRPHLFLDKETVIGLYQKYGNWKAVSSELGIGYSTMYQKLKEMNITKSWNN